MSSPRASPVEEHPLPVGLREDDNAREVVDRSVEVGGDGRLGRRATANVALPRLVEVLETLPVGAEDGELEPVPPVDVPRRGDGAVERPVDLEVERVRRVAQAPALRDARGDEPRWHADACRPRGGARREGRDRRRNGGGSVASDDVREAVVPEREDLEAGLAAFFVLPRDRSNEVEHAADVVVVDVAHGDELELERRPAGAAVPQLVEPRPQRALVDAGRSAVDEGDERARLRAIVEQQAVALSSGQRLEREDHVKPPGARAGRPASRCPGSNARARGRSRSRTAPA